MNQPNEHNFSSSSGEKYLDLQQKLEKAEKKIRMFEGLFEANAAITSSLNRQEVLRLVMSKARQLLNTEAASIFLIDYETNELVLEVSTNLPKDSEKNIRFPLGKGITGWVAQTGQPVLTDDITSHPQYWRGQNEESEFITKSYLCVPLRLGKKIIGTAQVLNRTNPEPFQYEDRIIMEGFARQAAIAIENSRLHEEELMVKQIEEELEQARRIQSKLLPELNPRIEGYDISGRSYACRWVGGDYYDYLELPDGKLGLVIADVCGKGVPAAVMMASLQASLVSLIGQNLSPQEVVIQLNRYFHRSIASDKFVTFFHSELDYLNHNIKYVNAGHNPPLLVRRNGEISKLSKGGMVLGVEEENVYNQGDVHIGIGDILLLYTDGITEISKNRESINIENLLIRKIQNLSSLDSDNIIDNIYKSAMALNKDQNLPDDFTLVCIKRTG